jgi:hypothetical protein
LEEADDATTSLYLFARGVNHAIWYTSTALAFSGSSTDFASLVTIRLEADINLIKLGLSV